MCFLGLPIFPCAICGSKISHSLSLISLVYNFPSYQLCFFKNFLLTLSYSFPHYFSRYALKQGTIVAGILTKIKLHENSEEAKDFLSETTTEKSRDFDILENIETVKDGLQIKEQTNITEADTKLCEDTNEDFQPIFENKEETQNASNDLFSAAYFDSRSDKGTFANDKSPI